MTTYGLADGFNRADAADLGANWAEAVGGWELAGNQASSTGAGSNTARHLTPLANSQHRAAVTVAGILSGPVIRIDVAGANYYRVFFASSSTLRIQRVDGGAPTSFDESVAEPAAPYALMLAADGSDVIAYVNGVESSRLAGENSHTSNVHAGIFAAGAGRTADDWSADLSVVLDATVNWVNAGANRIQRGPI